MGFHLAAGKGRAYLTGIDSPELEFPRSCCDSAPDLPAMDEGGAGLTSICTVAVMPEDVLEKAAQEWLERRKNNNKKTPE
jgi:hypothetical protein